MNHNEAINFPPFKDFDNASIEKYQKYWNDDEWHHCYKDPEFRPYKDIIADNAIEINDNDIIETKEEDLSDEDDFKNFEYGDEDAEEDFSDYNYWLFL